MKKAFTLIELIVVIAIISIITLILMPEIGSYINNTNETVCISNANEIEKQILYAQADEKLSLQDLINNHGKNAKNLTDPIDLEIEKSCNLEGKYISYFTDGLLEVVFDGESVTAENTPGPSVTEEPVVTKSNPILTDSGLNEHEVTARHLFEELKDKFEWGGLNLNAGDIISDGEKTYAIYWNPYISEPGGEYDIEDLYNKNKSNMVEITENSKIITDADIDDSGYSSKWKEPVSAGTVAYYNGEYYISPSNLNTYTFPPGGWVNLNMEENKKVID